MLTLLDSLRQLAALAKSHRSSLGHTTSANLYPFAAHALRDLADRAEEALALLEAQRSERPAIDPAVLVAFARAIPSLMDGAGVRQGRELVGDADLFEMARQWVAGGGR